MMDLSINFKIEQFSIDVRRNLSGVRILIKQFCFIGLEQQKLIDVGYFMVTCSNGYISPFFVTINV